MKEKIIELEKSELIKIWVNRGREVLSEKHWDYWKEIVPIRLRDLYEGMELGCCLSIITALNNDSTLEEAKAIIESQDHSGMSWVLVCSMVNHFCDRGKDFCEFVK